MTERKLIGYTERDKGMDGHYCVDKIRKELI